MADKKLITEGISDGLLWIVIASGVVLAVLSQAFKAAAVKPPLTIKEIFIRSGGAGVAALSIGLIALGSGYIEPHWALFMGLGGVIGYWGQEALAWVVQLIETKASSPQKEDKE